MELGSTNITIDGKVYRLCADLKAMAEAEERFKAEGHKLDLVGAIMGLREPSILAVAQIFVCSLYRYHSQFGFSAAQDLFMSGSITVVGNAVARLLEALNNPLGDEANGQLCFEFSALADAEDYFVRSGAMARGCFRRLQEDGDLNLRATREIFACALHKRRPRLSLEGAQKLMNLASVILVGPSLQLQWDRTSEREHNEFLARVMSLDSWTKEARA